MLSHWAINGPRIDKTVSCFEHARELKYSCWIMIVVACYCVCYSKFVSRYTHNWHTHGDRWRTVCCSHSRCPCECGVRVWIHTRWCENYASLCENAHTICRLIEEAKNQSGKKTVLLLTLRLAFELRPLISSDHKGERKKNFEPSKRAKKSTNAHKHSIKTRTHVHTLLELVLGIEHIDFASYGAEFLWRTFQTQ